MIDDTQRAAQIVQAPARKKRSVAIQREIVVLVAMIVFNLLFTPHFVSLQTFNVNLTQVVTIVIVGIGMTLVVATGGIDLSVGASMAIAGALAPMLFMNIAGPPGIALAFTLPIVAAALCGVFNGLLVTRLRVQPIVATLVLFIAGRGIAQVVTDGSLQAFANPAFQWIALGKVAGVPFQILLMLALVAVFTWIVRKTLFGKYLRGRVQRGCVVRDGVAERKHIARAQRPPVESAEAAAQVGAAAAQHRRHVDAAVDGQPCARAVAQCAQFERAGGKLDRPPARHAAPGRPCGPRARRREACGARGRARRATERGACGAFFACGAPPGPPPPRRRPPRRPPGRSPPAASCAGP